MQKTLLLAMLLLLIFSCSKQRSEIQPAFIEVNSFQLTTTSSQGSDRTKITDAWVYVNDQLLGVFELPAKIPSLLTGLQNVKVYAGIKKNGIANQRAIYPFYTFFNQDVDLVPGSTTEINPNITYKSGINIWIEDFEDTGIKFDRDTQSDTIMLRNTVDPLEGNASGIIELGASDLYFKARTNEPLFNRDGFNPGFPKNAQPIYIEMDYKTNIEMNVGIYHNDGSLAVDAQSLWFTATPNTDWNKIYIDITEPVNNVGLAKKFDIYLSCVRTLSSPPTKIEIDNVKVVF